MASSSSSSQRPASQEVLPLIPCPYCGEKILTYVSGASSSKPGQRFYKCIQKDAGRCKFYEWQEGYARFIPPHLGANVVQNQIQEGAPQNAALALDQHIGAILAIVRDLLKLNLMVAGTNLTATALLLALFVAICAIVIMSRSSSA
ncbi:hypothetical protein ACQJBY_045173 [Aegilops geniculata]